MSGKQADSSRTAIQGASTALGIELDGRPGRQMYRLLQAPLVVEGIDPDVPFAGDGLVQHQAIDSLAIGGHQMFAVMTCQGGVEEGYMQGLTGRHITGERLQGQLAALDLEGDTDAQRLGAIELLRS